MRSTITSRKLKEQRLTQMHRH